MTRLARSPVVQLALWRVREFMREPEAVFWIFAFPLLMAFALGLAFTNRPLESAHVAVPAGRDAAVLAERLNAHDRVEAEVLDPAEAYNRLRAGRVSIVVHPGSPPVAQYDSTRPESQLARLLVDEALQRAAGREDVIAIRDRRVDEPGARYIDFLIPGLLGLNIMGTGLWGVGYGIVKNRTHHLLKRFLASPMRKRHYIFSFILARLVFLFLEASVLLVFGYVAFGVPLRGSVLALAGVVVLGAMMFAGIGVLVASRARTIEGISGLMNLVMVPMWIFSGVFFAYSNFPDAAQPFIKALPLTALNDAIRAVMLDGAGVLSQIGPIAMMAVWGVGSFVVALRIFRWE
ncbi:MAG: ABC transporter permease [Gemmatimonadales bacterium]|jgi:ABC-type multidrug transport system permease subunit